MKGKPELKGCENVEVGLREPTLAGNTSISYFPALARSPSGMNMGSKPSVTTSPSPLSPAGTSKQESCSPQADQ